MPTWAAWELLRSPPPESRDLDVTVWSGVQAELQWGGQHAQRPAGDRDPGPRLLLPRHCPGFCMRGGHQRLGGQSKVCEAWGHAENLATWPEGKGGARAPRREETKDAETGHPCGVSLKPLGQRAPHSSSEASYRCFIRD